MRRATLYAPGIFSLPLLTPVTVLVVGSGGREHALVVALSRSPRRPTLLCAPGNPGTAEAAENVAVAADDLDGLVALATDRGVGLVIVGPEVPLVAGLADRLTEAGIPVVGPSKAAARLEGSKAFAKDAMARFGVPTASSRTFGLGELDEARAYVDGHPLPVVLKADGLAAGKGVTVAETVDQAHSAIDAIFDGEFGDTSVVIEDFMEGEEASFFVLCDGRDCLAMGTAQDHKRVGEGDTGPNTGGMGAYSPAPVLTESLQDQVMTRIVRPTIAEMAARGTPFQGMLYAGLMIAGGEARLVEYNVRFGDPECQALMLRLGAQALDLLLACAEGRLAETQITWGHDHAMTVVMATKGYPGSYEKGTPIRGLDRLPESSFEMVFHAGTAERDGRIIATGGRVLACTGRGATLAEAHDRAYALVDAIDWPDGFCRRDIGWRAL